jgi:telomerase reverse transcriptase
MLGGSILGGNELYAKLKAFKARLLTNNPSGVLCASSLSLLPPCTDTLLGSPKLYFVKVDVQACFDSITQDKLLSILHKILSEVSLHGWYGTCADEKRRMDTSFSASAR